MKRVLIGSSPLRFRDDLDDIWRHVDHVSVGKLMLFRREYDGTFALHGEDENGEAPKFFALDAPLQIGLGTDNRVSIPWKRYSADNTVQYFSTDVADVVRLASLIKIWQRAGGRISVRGIGKEALTTLAALVALGDADVDP